MGRARTNAETEEKLETVGVEIEEKKEVEAETEEKIIEYVIEAPNKAYTGTTATVEFKDGKGVTSNKVILEYFKTRGYKITKK